MTMTTAGASTITTTMALYSQYMHSTIYLRMYLKNVPQMILVPSTAPQYPGPPSRDTLKSPGGSSPALGSACHRSLQRPLGSWAKRFASSDGCDGVREVSTRTPKSMEQNGPLANSWRVWAIRSYTFGVQVSGVDERSSSGGVGNDSHSPRAVIVASPLRVPTFAPPLLRKGGGNRSRSAEFTSMHAVSMTPLSV